MEGDTHDCCVCGGRSGAGLWLCDGPLTPDALTVTRASASAGSTPAQSASTAVKASCGEGVGARASMRWPAAQVVRSAQEGDPQAIVALVSGSHAHVRRFARTWCASPEDAEDAAQEALIVLYRRIGTLRATAALAAWMLQIVRRECIRRARLALLRGRVASSVAADGATAAGGGVVPSAEDVALARLEMQQVVKVIAGLPEDQRAVLVLRDIQGLSGAASAQALGLSRAAMKSRLHRARTSVRSGLNERVGTEVGAVEDV